MKNLFLTGLLGLGIFCSCSNEDDPANNGKLNGEQTYAQLVINVASNNTTTRALDGSTGGTNIGTADEYAVKNLKVILANENDIVTDIIETTLKTATDNDDSDKAIRVTEPFTINAGSYKVYVLANYNEDALGSISINNTNMKSVFSILDASKLSDASNGFLMTNTAAPEYKAYDNKSTTAEVEDNGTETPDGEQVNLIAIDIERVVSKVTFDNLEPSAGYFPVKVGEDEFKAYITGVSLINLNKKMYMVKGAEKATNKPVLTEWAYPKDPNYSTVLSGSDNETWLDENFSQRTPSAYIAPDATPTFYCPENTMTANAQQNGQTTGVIFKVEYENIPGTAFTQLSTKSGDIYGEKFNAVCQLDDKNVNIAEDMFIPSGLYNRKDAFYSYNNLIFFTKNAAFMYKAVVENKDSNLETAATNINTVFGGYVDAGTAEGVNEYTAGVAYYKTWIKHNPTSTTNMEQDKYGVVRNFWYELKVNSISGFGSYKPDVEPTDPDDKAEANIQVQLNIKPWTIVKQDVDL